MIKTITLRTTSGTGVAAGTGTASFSIDVPMNQVPVVTATANGGLLTLSTDIAADIYYRLNGGVWQLYTAPVPLARMDYYAVSVVSQTVGETTAYVPPPMAIPAVQLQPVVAAPLLAGVQVGSIDAAAVSLTLTVAAGTLSGSAVTVGNITAASVSLRPSVSPATLSGVQVGSMSVPAVTLRPSVAVGTLTGVEAVSVGSIATASTTMQIQVNPPTLRGVTAGTAIRAPDGTLWDLRDIHGVPLDIRAVA